MNFILQHISDILAVAVLVSVVALVVAKLIRNKKSGKSPCGCDCGSCTCGCMHQNKK